MKWFTESNERGHAYELTVLSQLQTFFNDATLRQTPRNHTFDFVGENKFIELKQRNLESSKYPDTMMGLNKIKYCEDKPEDYYFVFSFNDGLFYWKYNNEDELNYRSGGRRDRGYNEYKDYCYIPINLLKKI